MKLIWFLLFAALLLPIASCANPINARNASLHAQVANEAGNSGDWDTARRHWAKALVNAQLAGSPTQQLAVFNYEYGRALGVTCFYDEAEKYLLKAFELDTQCGGPAFMSLAELAHLKYDQKQYDKAVGYFERAIRAMEKAHAAEKAPAGFAIILDEYASAMENTGRLSEAKDLRGRATELRKLKPEVRPSTERTPYGTQCNSNKGS